MAQAHEAQAGRDGTHELDSIWLSRLSKYSVASYRDDF
jgi:hypothetical protein